MPVDYDTFRTKPWGERVTLFNAISAEEKAELVRTHISRWMEGQRQNLTAAQIELLDEWITNVRPELYVLPKSDEAMNRSKDLETRTAVLFSREQMRDALTMHWDQSCQVRRQ